MAIVVSEEGEQKIDILNIAIWVFLLVLIGVAAYLIFFRKPELVEVVSPSSFKNIDPLAKVALNPQEVVNSPDFRSLKQYVPLPSPASVGRSNPFLVPF